MTKNLIIAFEAIVIVGLAVDLSWHTPKMSEYKIVRFPRIELGKNERITQAQISFQTAHIRGIRNIPPGWDTAIDLEVPPNPVFRGSIIVGAAALEATAELPELEVENYIEKTVPKALKATLRVAQYPGDLDEEREVEIELNKP
jgi:hypothetical protein